MIRLQHKTVIGLTGNIGVGKSTVMALLAELGAVGIDADKVAHEVMAPGQPAYDPIVARFGPQIAPGAGPIDRLRLGEIVFSDPAALADLEAIVHPAVFQVIQRRVAEASAPVVVIEAIKLLEAGLSRQLCQQVWVVTAPRKQQIQRLMQSRGLSEAEATLRIDAQPPQAAKVAQADVVIENGGSLEEMRVQVARAFESVFYTEFTEETQSSQRRHRVRRGDTEFAEETQSSRSRHRVRRGDTEFAEETRSSQRRHGVRRGDTEFTE